MCSRPVLCQDTLTHFFVCREAPQRQPRRLRLCPWRRRLPPVHLAQQGRGRGLLRGGWPDELVFKVGDSCIQTMGRFWRLLNHRNLDKHRNSVRKHPGSPREAQSPSPLTTATATLITIVISTIPTSPLSRPARTQGAELAPHADSDGQAGPDAPIPQDHHAGGAAGAGGLAV